jgi:maltodextrin utilization protein YvdJ
MASWCVQFVRLYQYGQVKKDQITGALSARMEVKHAYRVVVGRPKKKTLMEELDKNGRMILKEFSKKKLKI